MAQFGGRLTSAWLVTASLCVMATAVSAFRLPHHHAHPTSSSSASHDSTQARRNAEIEHRYFDEYDVPRKLLERKGGIKKDKSQLIKDGKVFFAFNLRPLVSDAKGHFQADFNFGRMAVCEGQHIAGLSMQNRTSDFRLFACPTDEVQAALMTTVEQAVRDGVQMFCCHDPPNQRCCSREEFYKTYGSLKSSVTLAMKLFFAICVLVVLIMFVACIALIVCCCAVLPGSLQGKKPQHQRAAGTMRPLFPAGSQQNQQFQPQDYGATNTYLGAYSVQSASFPQESQQQQQQQQQQQPLALYPTINQPENQQLQPPIQLNQASRYSL